MAPSSDHSDPSVPRHRPQRAVRRVVRVRHHDDVRGRHAAAARRTNGSIGSSRSISAPIHLTPADAAKRAGVDGGRTVLATVMGRPGVPFWRPAATTTSSRTAATSLDEVSEAAAAGDRRPLHERDGRARSLSRRPSRGPTSGRSARAARCPSTSSAWTMRSETELYVSASDCRRHDADDAPEPRARLDRHDSALAVLFGASQQSAALVPDCRLDLGPWLRARDPRPAARRHAIPALASVRGGWRFPTPA